MLKLVFFDIKYNNILEKNSKYKYIINNEDWKPVSL